MNDAMMLTNGTEGATTTSQEIVYEFSRAALLDGWWAWTIFVGVISLLIYLCTWLYRKDTTEISAGVRTTMLVLRLTTIAAIIFFFFGIQRRAQQ